TRPAMARIVERIDPRQARRPVWLLASAALAAVVVTAASAVLRPQLRCRGAPHRLRGGWGARGERPGRAGVLAPGARPADERYAAVERTLDGYARAWIDLDQHACTATRVDHEQSYELYDLRMACLGQRLGELRAFTELLAHADAGIVGAAASGATRL